SNNSVEAISHDPMKQIIEQSDKEMSVKSEPNDSPSTAGVSILQRGNDNEVIDEKSVYTLPPFWRLPLAVSKGYRGGYYVRGVKYVQLTTLIHNDALSVSLEAPIRLEMNGEIKTFTFNDVLLANGIAINDPHNCSEISRLENFKGSEGWLDAFKRRHRIDLKLMSGVPVNYEETDDDKMEDDHEDSQNTSRQLNSSQVLSE
ncbi:hypothetical protein TELCIR_16998, partial [Teladorsagia circumcincta]